MEYEMVSSEFSKEAILQNVIKLLDDITLDWDMEFDGPIGAHSRLIADLAFESIDVVQFVAAIEECFQRRRLPWEEFLMIDGRYVDEIKVEDAVTFLFRHLNTK